MPFIILIYCCYRRDDFYIVTESYEPYIGHDLENMGWTAEVGSAALKSEGYKINTDLSPWARALHDAKHGKYDGLLYSFLY